eukprot:3196980-Prymnesium_polylepis.2
MAGVSHAELSDRAAELGLPALPHTRQRRRSSLHAVRASTGALVQLSASQKLPTPPLHGADQGSSNLSAGRASTGSSLPDPQRSSALQALQDAHDRASTRAKLQRPLLAAARWAASPTQQCAVPHFR